MFLSLIFQSFSRPCNKVYTVQPIKSVTASFVIKRVSLQGISREVFTDEMGPGQSERCGDDWTVGFFSVSLHHLHFLWTKSTYFESKLIHISRAEFSEGFLNLLKLQTSKESSPLLKLPKRVVPMLVMKDYRLSTRWWFQPPTHWGNILYSRIGSFP